MCTLLHLRLGGDADTLVKLTSDNLFAIDFKASPWVGLMLNAHSAKSGDTGSQTAKSIWVDDLLNPTPDEVARVAAESGIEVPPRKSLQEIETSSRLRAYWTVSTSSPFCLRTNGNTPVYRGQDEAGYPRHNSADCCPDSGRWRRTGVRLFPLASPLSAIGALALKSTGVKRRRIISCHRAG
jgi:hypothetical protein